MISFSNRLAGMPVWARDGEIGSIADILVDVSRWRVIYFHVSIGWLFGRDVIVPTQKVTQVDIPGGPVQLALGRREIEASPAAANLGSLDEGYEKELLGYYGMTEEANARTARLPSMAEPVERPAAEATAGSHRPPLPASGMDGYRIDADGGTVGRVRDLVIDLNSWHVISLTADLGGFLNREIIEIDVSSVIDVDRDERLVHVSLSRNRLERMPRLSEGDTPSQSSVPPRS